MIFQLLGLAFILNSVVMSGAWLFARTKNNYSIVDAVWACCFSLTGILFVVAGNGYFLRRALMLACLAVWSLRLTFFLARRIASHHPVEDSRYVALRQEYGERVGWRFFLFYQYQAWSVVLLSGPFILMAINPLSELGVVEYAGAAMFLFSLAGESLADRQATAFKKQPENRGKVCDVGLWKFSRHPNYFFESCIWFSFFVMALGSPNGFYAIYAPLLILFLLLKVTGVPMSESQSIKNRGEAYRSYQQRTSVFIPWFPKAAFIFFVGTLLTSPVLRADGLPKSRLAKIYVPGQTKGAPLFVQKTYYKKISSVVSGDRTEATTSITDQEKKLVLTERAEYVNERLVFQAVEQLQTNDYYEVEVKNQKIHFRERKLNESPEKMKESIEKYTDDFIVGPTIESYLALKWEDVAQDKTVTTNFGVPELRKSIGFDFKVSERLNVDQRKIVRFVMQPSRFILRALVDKIVIDIDAGDKRYVRYLGRTPLKIKKNEKWESFDAEILYEDF